MRPLTCWLALAILFSSGAACPKASASEKVSRVSLQTILVTSDRVYIIAEHRVGTSDTTVGVHGRVEREDIQRFNLIALPYTFGGQAIETAVLLDSAPSGDRRRVFADTRYAGENSVFIVKRSNAKTSVLHVQMPSGIRTQVLDYELNRKRFPNDNVVFGVCDSTVLTTGEKREVLSVGPKGVVIGVGQRPKWSLAIRERPNFAFALLNAGAVLAAFACQDCTTQEIQLIDENGEVRLRNPLPGVELPIEISTERESVWWIGRARAEDGNVLLVGEVGTSAVFELKVGQVRTAINATDGLALVWPLTYYIDSEKSMMQPLKVWRYKTGELTTFRIDRMTLKKRVESVIGIAIDEMDEYGHTKHR